MGPMKPQMQQQPGYSPRIQYKPLQQPTRPQRDREPKKSDNGGLLGGLLSDERSKKEIARLEGQNDALTAALDKSFTGSNMPPTEYPRMPENTRLPVGQANFPDAPAEKVAAQNVAMQATAPQPMGMQPNPSQSNMTMSQSPAFNVQRGAPDLSALDEAYKRMGQGG